MDNKTLITIVVTAVITEITKRLVGWLLVKFNASETAKTLSATAKKWLIKEVFSIAFDMAAMLGLAMLAVHLFLFDRSPATRQDVSIAMGIILVLMFFFADLIFNILLLILRRAAGR